MDCERFYHHLFAPVAAEYGPLDPQTRFHLIGFDAGGPVNYCTVGADRGEQFVTCVTCELAPRSEQQRNSSGGYELLMTCDDEKWCSAALTRLAQMSLEVIFDHGHTVDIGPWVGPAFPVQGIAFEHFATVCFERRDYGILLCQGLSRPELEFAQQFDVEQLLQRRRAKGIYPKTSVKHHREIG